MKQSISRPIHQIFRLFILFACISLTNGCSDSFLKEEPVLEGSFEPIYVETQNGELQMLTLDLSEAGNAPFQIRQYPNWIQFQEMNGVFSNGMTTIPFKILPEALLNSGNSGDVIISIKGFGLVLLDVIVGKKEEPAEISIFISPEALDFQSEVNELSFTMHNQATEFVSWKMVSCPDWIQLEKTEGLLQLYESVSMKATCIRSHLAPGTHTARITLEFSQPNGTTKTRHISVSARVLEYTNPTDLIEIEGSVADAAYCEETDRLFIATRNPNRLLIYGQGEKISAIDLSKAPNCITLSEKGKQLFIGHSGLISYLDSSTQQVNQTFELDFNVFSLAYGENGRLYISPDADFLYEPIVYLNVNTGQLLRKESQNLYGGRAYLKKIKDTPTLLCTRTMSSPSGATLLDISDGTPGVEKYWHLDMGGNFWFSKNHQYLYDAYGKIFATPNFNTGQDLLPLGKLDAYMNANWIDHCPQTNSLWVARNESFNNEDNVLRYHAEDYRLLESFKISPYATTINGTLSYYNTIPHYIFSDKTGTRVYIIKNVFISYFDNPDAWSMEIIND